MILKAIFEVVSSEASYHLNLTTITDDFMDDPRLTPSHSEGEKVMNRTQYSTIFSNVKEIRDISARYMYMYIRTQHLECDILLMNVHVF